MSDLITLSKRAEEVEQSPEFSGVTKLVCIIDDETQISVGDDSGYTIEFENPIMTRSILTAMLNKIRGYQYQPYSADGALLDPAAEMGDAISVNGVYGGLFNRDRTFGELMTADIAAPVDEEIDHEYKFETKYERKVRREFGNVRATLAVQEDAITAEVQAREADSASIRATLAVHATDISARVTKTGGSNSSFGWSLQSDEFGLYSGNRKVFYVNATGAYVNGEIQAKSGQIGGFTIGTRAIYNNLSEYNGTQNSGVYIGTNGIQLGQNFQVNPSGNVYAKNLTVSGGSIAISDGDTTSFRVNTRGVVNATDLRITGGSIAIGGTSESPVFRVDRNGNLYANSGTFKGSVRAGSIQYGGDNGTFNAAGLTDLSIKTGKLNDYAVTEGKIGSSAITESKIGGGAVTNGKIGGGAVSYGKTSLGVQGTLDQVGVNKSNIEALQGYFTGSASFSSLNATAFYLGGQPHHNATVPIDGFYMNVVTWGW